MTKQQKPPKRNDQAGSANSSEVPERVEAAEAAVLKKSPAKRKRAPKVDLPDADVLNPIEAPEHASQGQPPEPQQRAATDEPTATQERTVDQGRLALKRKVRMMYDLQRLRLQAGGRTLERPTKPDSEEKVQIFLHEVDLAILEQRKKDLHRVEKEALKDVEAHLETIPFYRDVLSDKSLYKGIGPTMAGVILSEFDIRRADTVSKMWAFSGLISKPAFRCKKCFTLCNEDDGGKERRAELEAERQAAVAEVTEARVRLARAQADLADTNGQAAAQDELDRAIGKATRLKQEVERTPLGGFTHRGKAPKGCKDPLTRDDVRPSGEAQRPQKGVKLPYNSFLRVKLVGVLGPVLIKMGSPWSKAYYDYKHRLQSRPDGWGRNDGHRHQASIRYMIKMLLLDIHKRWREYEGLPVRPPYSVEKLGMAPHSNPIRPEPSTRAEREDSESDDEVDVYESDIAAELEMLEKAS